jgi:hypothetical protein
MQRGRRGQPVRAGHLHVEQGDVRRGAVGRLDHLAAVADRPHDLDVPLEIEHRGQRAADQRLVVGQQHPDHPRASA